MTKPCDICGREMMRLNIGDLAGQFACMASPDQHKIAVLERELAEAKARIGQDGSDLSKRRIHFLEFHLSETEREREEAQSQLRQAQEQVVALREAASKRFVIKTLPDGHVCIACWRTARDGAADILHEEDCVFSSATATATAQQTVARIEREALEKAVERDVVAMGFTRGSAIQQAHERAILGEHHD